MLRREINRIRASVDELRDRYRSDAEAPQRTSHNGAVTGHLADTDAEFQEAQTQILQAQAARHRIG